MHFRQLSCAVAVSALLIFSTPAVKAKDTGYIFVSSEKDNVITVLDGKTYAHVKDIGTAARPRHMDFNADRTLLYVACGDGSAIDIIDIAKLELVNRIADVRDPEVFDFSLDGKTLYISLEDDAALGFLDLETYFNEREGVPDLAVAAPTEGELSNDDDDDDDDDEDEDDEDGEDAADLVPGLSTVEVGAEPEAVLLHPEGKLVYVASEVANVVHVVDVEEKEIVKNIVVGNRPRRFVLTPDLSELWVTNELSGSVTVLNASTYEILEEISFLPQGMRKEDVTPVGITMTEDAKTVIVTLGRANHVAFVNAESREIEDYVLVGNRAWNGTLTRDNKLLFVANGLSDDISIIDVASRKTLKSIRVGRVPYAVLIDD